MQTEAEIIRNRYQKKAIALIKEQYSHDPSSKRYKSLNEQIKACNDIIEVQLKKLGV